MIAELAASMRGDARGCIAEHHRELPLIPADSPGTARACSPDHPIVALRWGGLTMVWQPARQKIEQ
jgi:hypothetical protein